jgi:hypothetical protein
MHTLAETVRANGVSAILDELVDNRFTPTPGSNDRI